MNGAVRTRVHDFLKPKLGGHSLSDNDDIFALGYVNSLFAMQLARFIQREFNLELAPGDMNFDNFRTVDAIVRLVDAKAGARTTPEARP